MFASCDESHQKCKDIFSDIKCESSVDNINDQLDSKLMLKEKSAYKHDQDSSEDSSDYSQANNANITTELEYPLNNCTIENDDEESENIYEEVYTSPHTFVNYSTEASLKSAHNSKVSYNRKSLVDEVMYEVEKVQRQHAQVLKELNLEVENMIMPAHSPATLSPVSSVAEFIQDNESNNFIYTTSCKNSGVHPSFQDHCKMVSKQTAPPPLPERITSSGSRFFPSENLVNIEGGIITSTPVSKCKWSKTPTWMQPKGMKEIQDTNFSDDSIYEDIDQHLCDEISQTKLDSGHKQSENEKDRNVSRVIANNIPEKSVSSLGFSNIRHKLRTVRQRMSKLKEGIKESGNTTVSLQETERISQFDGNSLISKMPQDIKFHLHPPNLPPPPKGLSSDQIKRRCIISTLVHSENTYFSTLKRLLHDYKKPLEESHPPILNKAKIDTLFFRIPEIQQCHAMFRIALADCVKHWDKEEKIGEVFVASFSKSMVFEIYSDFINNFSIAMELAKTESKRKAAFSDFLKVKQVTSHDRLTFFGLMVKPVQRFPQFIMLLQDLLKLTPSHHCDRLNLQLALTQLESLAERLNERKRESEQHHAVQELFRHINVKFALKPLSDSSNFLIREDNVLLLKFDQENQLVKTKERKLFLLNNLLICVAVSLVPSPVRNLTEKYTLKWAVPVSEVEIQEEVSPVLNRMVISSGWGKQISPKSDANNIHIISQEISDLMNDFEVISRISSLIATLKKTYDGLSLDLMQSHLNSIIQIIQTKDEEMKWIDDCCLQLLLPIKSKNVKELVIFQTSGPKAHKEWVLDFHLAQLALNSDNNPAWDILEQEPIPSTKMPLFSCYFPVYQASYPTEVKSACYYTCLSKSLSSKVFNFLWICSTDGVNSHICILSLGPIRLKQVATFDLNEVRISTMEAVPGKSSLAGAEGFGGWTVWMGTDSRRILIFSGSEPERHESLGFVSVSAPVLQLRYYWNQVFASLTNGNVIIFQRLNDQEWQLKDYRQITLSTEPVTYLLPFNSSMYCACGRKVWMLDCATGEIMKSSPVHHEQLGNVYLLAHSGIGLWINLRNTSTICLYHMESFAHLQDINIASNINRILAGKKLISSPRRVFVTSLMACRGLLWVGTNVGVLLTIPLPRLEGVPIISGQASLSFHVLSGPITTLISLNIPHEHERKGIHSKLKRSTSVLEPCLKPKGVLQMQQSLPNILNDKANDSGEINSFEENMDAISSSEDYDVYGLYGDLLNVSEYEDDDVLRESLRRSEPDLLPTSISTLDRRVQIKLERPKSLDLTNLSSSQMHSSSSSENSLPTKPISSTPTLPSTLNYVPQFSQTCTDIPKSILVLMGGRGYANISQGSQVKTNSNDAHVIFWEMRC